MFKIYNNVEDKIVFRGNESELIDFVSNIRRENGDAYYCDENGDVYYSIEDIYMRIKWGVDEAIDYIEDFCDNLEFKYY